MVAIKIFDRSIGLADGIEIIEQLEHLLTAGLPLDRALKMLHGVAATASQKSMISEIILDIERGQTLADAFAGHPRAFDSLTVSVIRAGEEGGVLPTVMENLVAYQRSRSEFRRFLITSSLYPGILLLFGIFAVGGILVFVIPQFVESYGDLSSAGAAAQWLVFLSDAIVNYGWLGVLAIAAMGLALNAFASTEQGKVILQSFVIRLPVVGNLLVRSDLSKIFSTMGVLLTAGVPILKAVRLSRAMTTFREISAIFVDAERSLRDGTGISPSLKKELIPPLVNQLILVGEESGSLDRMLKRIGVRLESEVRDQLRGLVVIIEPLLILGIGLIIGVIVLSMISAIFSLNEMPL